MFIMSGTVQLIVIKTLATLLAKPTCIYHFVQQNARAVLGVSSLSVQDFHDGQACIKADKVSKLERTHGYIGAILHNGVNRVTVTNTSLKTDDSLIDIGHQNAVSQKSRSISRYRGNLAELLAELDGGIERLLASLKAADDLNALLNGNRVHKVSRNDAGRGRGISGVCSRSGRNFGDGDGGGVGRKDSMLWADICELAEDVEFELRNFWNGFDDEVNAREIFHLGARR